MKKIILLGALLCALFSLSAESFYIKNYDIKLDVAPNGKIHIDEVIDVYFTAPSHGIMRDIQDSFQNQNQPWDPIIAKITDIKATDLYKILTDGDYTTLTLGEADKLITGDKRYEISYDYDLGYDRYTGYDELYYNIISAAWNCNIENVTYSVTLPYAEGIKGTWVTAGDYSFSDLSNYTTSADGRTFSGSYSNLSPYQAITIRVEMEEGYYQGQSIPKDNTIFFLYMTFAAGIIVLGIIAVLFFSFGRDDELIVKAEFHPPFGLTPMDMGYILDRRIDTSKEITAMLFYWADKGYIKIEELTKDEFKFHKIKDLDSSEKDADKKLFNAIFKSGDTADADSMAKNGFYEKVMTSVIPAELRYFQKDKSLVSKTADKIKGVAVAILFVYTALFGLLCSTRYLGALTAILIAVGVFYTLIISVLASNFNRTYHLKGIGKRGLALLPGIITAAFTAMIMAGVLSDIAPVLLAIAAAVFYAFVVFSSGYLAMLMEKRSRYGQQVLEGTLGYKEFIELVEIDKLKVLIDQDPEIFYHTLCYAMAFGLEDQWARKFKGLYVPAASWYVSSTPVMDAYFYSKMSRRWRQVYTNSVLSAASAPVSGGGGSRTFSGSSGFAGGGFSGGGGRSW